MLCDERVEKTEEGLFLLWFMIGV